jgi:thiamine phosphate synthase YjbQ (UPF0047 family)
MIKRVLTLVNAMHITASVFINDDEYGLHQDHEKWLEELAPHAPTSQYLHNRNGEDNADAHLKRQVMGRDAQRWWRWPMADSTLARGSGSFKARRTGWPGSLDGRRRKRVLVEIIGE